MVPTAGRINEKRIIMFDLYDQKVREILFDILLKIFEFRFGFVSDIARDLY